ncbi:MAG: lysophospholipid acyltransferase family protein [Actinomycetota bacterium]|nr:lysophospholipid acyltransferase family protein [Actinomycetota bacterium]
MFTYIGYKILEIIVILSPYPVSYLIAKFGARLWFSSGANVRVTQKNVCNVLDAGISNKKARRIVLTIFTNWAKNIVDFLKHSVISREKLKERVDLKGMEHLNDALKKGRGVVIFTAHIGNFEWGACRIAVEGYDIWGVSLVRKSRLTTKFFESKRLSKGLKTLYINKMLHVFKILKNNGIVAIPSDWDPTGRASRPFTFFGKKAYFPTGALQITLKSGAEFMPSFIWRKGKYNHQQIIDRPLKLIREGDKETLIQRNMEMVLKVMEKYIRSHISEWEMFHDIWDKNNPHAL